jgi:hypothetical protein
MRLRSSRVVALVSVAWVAGCGITNPPSDGDNPGGAGTTPGGNLDASPPSRPIDSGASLPPERDAGPTLPPTLDGGTKPPTSQPDAGGPAHCMACLDNSSCVSSVCVQYPGDSYCSKSCGSDADCRADEACINMTTTAGARVNVCVPRNDLCTSTPTTDAGTGQPPPPSDGGATPDAATPPPADGGTSGCPDLRQPTEPAACTSCKTQPCQANGCYNGYLCDVSTDKCVVPTTPCPTPIDDGGAIPPVDAAAPTGTVGGDGGALSRLYFGVVGDTRPATSDDTANYPKDIITQIYKDISTLAQLPPFVLGTGDYMFASVGSSGKQQAGPQLDLYQAARQQYSGVFFPTMGNHECTGWTNSNCGTGNTDGVTDNYTAFIDRLLKPIAKTQPYYSMNINATDGAWTSKFVFVAANAWDDAQNTWFDGVMSKATTYTFIIRHEAKAANTAPGVTPSETIMAKYPYTLALVGHDHTYNRPGQREVIIGNGGAPVTGGVNYGYALLNQRTDGAIQVDMYDYQSGQADAKFRFAVKADGSTAP